MLVSTCSNLNIIQIEKNHTKTKRNDNKRNVFLKWWWWGANSFEILTTELTVRALKNKLNNKKKTQIIKIGTC